MRCICCGKDLVCCCLRCCGSGSHQKHKHLDSVPPTPYQNNQYSSQPPPVYGNNNNNISNNNPYGNSAFSQTATFEGKVHEDSLPAMPSWETAPTRKIEIQEEPEAHELEKLHSPNGHQSPGSGTISPPARPIPMRDGSNIAQQPGQMSPRVPQPPYGGQSPYGRSSPGPGGQNPYGSNQNFNGSRQNLGHQDDYFQGSRPNLPRENSDSGYRNESPYNNGGYAGGRPNLPRENSDGAYGRPAGSPYNNGGSRPNNPRENSENGYSSRAPYNNDGYSGSRNNLAYPNKGAGDPRPTRSPIYPTGNQATSPHDYDNRAGNASPRPPQYPGQATYPGQSPFGQPRGNNPNQWKDL
jgi:hypothetical protein